MILLYQFLHAPLNLEPNYRSFFASFHFDSILENDDDKFDRTDNDLGDPSIGLLFVISKGSHLGLNEYRYEDDLYRLHVVKVQS
ncbi:Peptidase, S54 family [Leptospira santarosai]|nr:Peptidase, S54 family [Leptospira santarosai]